jgi:hypothetical protein
MTPNHDHATLFVAPPTPPTAGERSGPQPVADDGTEAMERLLHPFTIPPAQTTATDTSPA